MERQGVDASGIVEIADEFTASCFINTDQDNNQIVAFYTGAMAYSKDLSLLDLSLGARDLVIISPTDPDAMCRYTDECRRMGVPFLFDPGKQTPRLDSEQILNGLRGASVLVGNDYEFAMLAKKIGWSEAELIAAAPLTVITRGAQGSTIYTTATNGNGASQHSSIEIPIAPVSEVCDPTGAGDAYLAGLVFGLARKLPLPVIGRIAALMATYAIEWRGCQEHRFTLAEFVERYTSVFGPTPELEALAEVEVRG
jgi:adenosine kinase